MGLQQAGENAGRFIEPALLLQFYGAYQAVVCSYHHSGVHDDKKKDGKIDLILPSLGLCGYFPPFARMLPRAEFWSGVSLSD